MAKMTAMPNLARRTLKAISLAVFLTVLMAVPASAKMTPFFTVAIVPAAPVAGQPIVIIVRTWADAAHTTPARLPTQFEAAALDGLLVLRPATGGAADIAIPLRFEAPDEFRATVTAPTAGEWRIVAFPDRTGWASPVVPPGYPDTIPVTVRPASGGATTVWMVVGLVAAVLAVAAARASARTLGMDSFGSALRSRRRRARRPPATEGTVR